MESGQTRALAFLLLAAAAFILLSGCALAVPKPEDKLTQTDWTVTQNTLPDQEVCKPPPGQFPCSCMVCYNHTSWAASLANYLYPWFDSSLKGGECNFEDCDPTTYQTLFTDAGKEKTTQGRTVMFGMGPSFSSTDSADLFCNYTLQLSAKWMVGKSAPPNIPVKARAECWLDRNFMPLYMYYTNGQYIDAGRTADIAAALDGAGPVLVTTEVNLDSSVPGNIAKVEAQLDALQSCAKCKKVLAVRTGDESALSQILGPPGQPSAYYSKVDIVGFGFRANDYPACDPTEIIGENYLFSRSVLYNYSKPTIWLYAGASEGKNIDGSCTWNTQLVHDFYQTVYMTSIGMASSGIMGASFYELTDRTGPLPCAPDEGCDFGVLKSDGTQKHPEINTWSSLCQSYGSQDFRNPLVFSKNGQGAICDFANTAQMQAGISTEINTTAGLQGSEVIPMEKQHKLGCGEVCVSDGKMQKPDVYNNLGGSISQAHCRDFPMIDELADDADVSQLYYRSIVNVETGGTYDPWLVSCNDAPCGSNFASIEDVCTAAGLPSGCPAHTIYGDQKHCPSGKPYFCAYGLSQCTEAPGSSDQYTATCGGSNYNPFEPGQSICCGMNKFKEYLDTARERINANWGALSDTACANSMTADEKPWAEYFLASEYYNGGPGNGKYSISSFLSQRDSSGQCSGEQNFVQYLRNQNDYGAMVMSVYVNSISNCDSDCAGK